MCRALDQNAAYPKAEASLKAAGILPEAVELRQVKYLNNLIEQDHRFIKRLTKPGMGFFSFETAWRTLQGFEVMNMIRKGQVQGVDKGDVRGQVALVARLGWREAGVAGAAGVWPSTLKPSATEQRQVRNVVFIVILWQ